MQTVATRVLQADTCKEIRRLRYGRAVHGGADLRFARDSGGMTTNEAHASATPMTLSSGFLRVNRFEMASNATNAASARNEAPTICSVSFFSRRSRFGTSASVDIRHSSAAPDVTSMKLSTPKPTSEMLPAIAPVW
jgi:hypothetical protein